MDKPSSFAHKEMSIFCFSDVQDWCKFSVFPVLLFYAAVWGSSVHNMHRTTAETLLSLMGQQGTICWHLIVV